MDSAALDWKPDVLGDAYRCLSLELGEDEEGPVVATLVSPARPGTALGAQEVNAVLYIHGWSDYFFQTELADFWSGRNVSFYALDLRKYGRSLRPGQSEGFVQDLREYDADIMAALQAMEQDLREVHGEVPVRISLMAHSTGGLVAALWANRHPGRIHALILNSPWLELRGSSMVRNATAGLLEPLARMRPKARLRIPELGFYWRSISSEADGEWDLDPVWRPRFSFPVRAGWIAAVLNGHAQVARGLDIRVPILVLTSARSVIAPVWTSAMAGSDSILDVTLMGQRSLLLGPAVTLYRFDGALHDVTLSALPVRQQVYARTGRWVDAFMLAP